MWRWLRFPLAILAAILVVMVAGTAWLLSGQRYQSLLTEHLSQLLGAEVRVAESRFSYTRGLGIEFINVTMQFPGQSAPFFTTERLAMFLDLKALVSGRLLFHELNASHPHIRIVDDSHQGLASVLGLLTITEKTISQADTPKWFTPTLAVRHVTIYAGRVEYTAKPQRVPLILSQLHVSLSHPESAGIVVRGSTTFGDKGELGKVVVRAAAPMWTVQSDQQQIGWQGSLQLQDVLSQPVGRALGQQWPVATLSANLRYDGKGMGPIQIDGSVDARNVHTGAAHLRTVAGRIVQLRWEGDRNQKRAPTWRGRLHSVTTEIHLEQIRGETTVGPRQFAFTKGVLTLRDGSLGLRNLSGTYGKNSRLRTGEIVASTFTSRAQAEVSVTFEADVDLQDDLDVLLRIFAKAGMLKDLPRIQDARGLMTVVASLYSPRFPETLSLDSEVSLQNVAFRLPSAASALTDLTGKLRITNQRIETIAAHPLSVQLRDSHAQITGQVVDYASPQPRIEVHISSDVMLADVPELEKQLTGAGRASRARAGSLLSQIVTDPRGQARVQMDIRTNPPSGAMLYDGTVTLQQAQFTVPKWNLILNGMDGTLHIDTDVVSTEKLAFEVGGASVELYGQLRDYHAPQKSGAGQVSFTGLSDHIVAPLLPQKLMLARGGTVDGRVGVTYGDGKMSSAEGMLTLNEILLDPLPHTFHPLGVTQGHVTWQGQNIALSIVQGTSAGGPFTGSGRVRSVTPLDLDLKVDFAALDLDAAFNLDKPKVDDQRPKNTTTQVRVNLQASHLQYKTFVAEQVRASCYWHDRQADLQVIEAKTAGGALSGGATFWPDSKELYLEPHVTGTDVSQVLTMLKLPSERITGSMNGEGKLYFPDWREWKDLARWRAHMSLAIADGVAQQIPVLVRLWSAVSLQELLSFQLPSLLNDGLAFSSLTGDFSLGEGVAITTNLNLVSSSVRLESVGEIDLARRILDLKTSFMPLHGITSSVAKVPLAGALLARGAEILTTLPFRVQGPYHDPTVTPLVIDLGQW